MKTFNQSRRIVRLSWCTPTAGRCYYFILYWTHCLSSSRLCPDSPSRINDILLLLCLDGGADSCFLLTYRGRVVQLRIDWTHTHIHKHTRTHHWLISTHTDLIRLCRSLALQGQESVSILQVAYHVYFRFCSSCSYTTEPTVLFQWQTFSVWQFTVSVHCVYCQFNPQ